MVWSYYYKFEIESYRTKIFCMRPHLCVLHCPLAFGWLQYGYNDSFSVEPIIWVRRGHESESGQMVLKKVKLTYFDAYLWQTMWNHAKKSIVGFKLSESVFSQWDARSSLLKSMKTRQTKTPVSHFFQILWPIQDGTMSKSMPRAFRKCVTYGGGDDLSPS